MAQCVFVGGGTRICSSSPYRVSRQDSTHTGEFPSLSREMKKALKLALRGLDEFEVPEPQKKMAKDVLEAVLAVQWNAAKTANSEHILKSVQLLLVDEVGDTKGKYTLVSY